MAMRVGLLVLFALASAACQNISDLGSWVVAPHGAARAVMSGGVHSGGVQPMPREGLGQRWRPLRATADSSEVHQAPGQSIDGDQETFWASAGKVDEARLTLAFPQRQAFRWALVKTGPMPDGATFKFLVSDDNATWTPAYGRTTNSTWGMELQDIHGEGRFLQVRFYSRIGGPALRFTVHELEVYGGAAPGPSDGEGG